MRLELFDRYTPKCADMSDSEEEAIYCSNGHPLELQQLPKPGLDRFCPKCDDIVNAGQLVLACLTCSPYGAAEGKFIACCKECRTGEFESDEGCVQSAFSEHKSLK
jgi:hypothetical protein